MSQTAASPAGAAAAAALLPQQLLLLLFILLHIPPRPLIVALHPSLLLTDLLQVIALLVRAILIYTC
jgi:hypothetical protein